jgi:hypothetical protein
MGETWNSLVGSLIPKGSRDVSDLLKKALKSRLFKHKNDDPDLHAIADEAWEKAGRDPDVIIEALEATFKKRAGYEFLYSCLKPSSGSDKKGTDSSAKTPLREEEGEKPGEPQSETPFATNGKNNFIFLYRSIRHHPWFKKKPAWVKLLFIQLCLDAAWKEHEVEWKKTKIMLQRGQYIISERDLAIEYDQSPRMMHYWLQKLENEGMVDIKTIYFKNGIYVAGSVAVNVAVNVAGLVAAGSIVTICKYDDYQAQKSELVAGSVAGSVAVNVAVNVAQTEEGIKEGETKERKTEEGRIPPTPLTKIRLFEIWEENRGPLPTAVVKEYSKVTELVEVFNEMGRENGIGPEEKWAEFVRTLGSTTHYTNRHYMSPVWLAKDLGRINSVLAGTYQHDFGRSQHDERTEARKRKNRGGSGEYPGKDGKELGGTSGTSFAITPAKMRKVSGRGSDLEPGKDQVPGLLVPGIPESGKSD